MTGQLPKGGDRVRPVTAQPKFTINGKTGGRMAGPMEAGETIRRAATLLAALDAGLAPKKVLALMLEWGLMDPELLRPRSRRPSRRRPARITRSTRSTAASPSRSFTSNGGSAGERL